MIGTDPQKLLSVSSVRGSCRGAVALSFDYETSAPYGNLASTTCRLRGRVMELIDKFRKSPADLSFCYGMGYAMRHGTDNIMNVLHAFGIHATWFATGHALLKDNRQGRAFRINRRLPYATPEAGFTDIVTWRRDQPTFDYDPCSDFHHYPYWYFGDQSQRLRNLGEDIQCHTFSHHHVALENAENVRIDLEDWQNAARHNGFRQASIMAFPFGGDAYRDHPEKGSKTMLNFGDGGISGEIVGLSPEIIEAIMSNGIELVTRCASKHDEFACFDRYGASGLFWMPDMEYDPLTDDVTMVGSLLEKTLADGGIPVNLWMHPCSAFSNAGIIGFEKLVRYLTEENHKGNIWLATISDLWSHHKKARLCNLIVERCANDVLTVAVKNKNTSDVNELGLIMNGARFKLMKPDHNIAVLNDRLIIDHLSADETYEFKIQAIT